MTMNSTPQPTDDFQNIRANLGSIQLAIKEMSLTKEELEKLQIEKEIELIIPFFCIPPRHHISKQF
ncbi:hypothetical protein L5515_002294 [Caenorhabditis briggsae]|uniref:Uncharacterized protein n=1 Tax=Caenorhabditis briggsae TaxID=6238 RepID=A0AAE9E768_CAEBR|nr:hypothetical protein L5515_002294 [Caenorhabditis briggsae]